MKYYKKMVLLNKIKSRGFTLIELMVVIAIIALLSSVVLAGMKGAKDNASTAALVASFRQIQIAMEQYKNATGYYPYENDVSNKSWSYTFGLTDNITPNLTTVDQAATVFANQIDAGTNQNQVFYEINVASGLTANTFYFVKLPVSAYLDASAEL